MTVLGAYTILHVAISLVGIAAGFLAMTDLLRKSHSRVTIVFLSMTILTSVTGFGFPASHVTPAHILGFISLLALGAALYALSAKHLSGVWSVVYVVAAVIAQYLNVFVLIVQSFQKLPPLRALAPTQSEPPFVVLQLVVLTGFILFTMRSIARRRKSLSTLQQSSDSSLPVPSLTRPAAP